MAEERIVEDYPSQEIVERHADIVRSAIFTNFKSSLETAFSRAYKHEKKEKWSRDYPKNAMLDDNFKLAEPIRKSLEAFKEKRPYKCSNKEFLDAVQVLYAEMSAFYGIPTPALRHVGPWDGPSASSFYTPHAITLSGHRSVITALHEYVHARGYGETAAVWWSTNAFRIVFPNDFKNLRAAQDLPYKPRSAIERDKPENSV